MNNPGEFTNAGGESNKLYDTWKEVSERTIEPSGDETEDAGIAEETGEAAYDSRADVGGENYYDTSNDEAGEVRIAEEAETSSKANRRINELPDVMDLSGMSPEDF